jgi:hypothetical protein
VAGKFPRFDVSSKVLTPRIRVSQIANAQKKQRHRFSSLKR